MSFVRLAIAILVLLLAVSAAHARELPVRVDGDGVTVLAEDGMDRAARRIAASAPGTIDRIYADLPGLPRPAHVEIRLVRDAADLGSVAPGPVPDWAVGLAYPGRGLVLAAARRGHVDTDLDNVVVHELAHMSLGAALGGRAPRWLDEGFAYLHSSEWSFERSRTLTGMAWTGDRYFLYELEDRFPAGENQAHRAYAQSYDFVAFLALRGRYADDADDGYREPFREFLAAVARGASLDDAALEAYARRMAQLEDEWWTSLRERYMLAPIGMFTLLVWCFGAVLLVLAWLRRRRQARAKLALWAEQERHLDVVDPGDLP